MMTSSYDSAADMYFRRAQNITLWLMAAAHLAVLLSFLLILGSLSPAAAQEAAACTGRNLLEDLRTENPAAYAQVMAEGDKIPNGKGILWKIEKAGTASSYLLGTMHVTDPRVLKMPPGAAQARIAANTIVVESSEVLDEQKSTATLLMKPELTMFTDGRSLDTLLSKEDLQILQAELKRRGIVYSAISRMKPWMLMGAVALPACESARKGSAAFLDKQIALDAVAAGKQLKGLETIEEQISAINSVPIEMQLKSIIDAVKFGEKLDDLFFTMIDLYTDQNVGVLMPLMKAVALDGGEFDDGYAEFERLVVIKRNHLMAERAAPILAEGSAFVAVGALHLPGNEGLVELLRGQGFTVTAVD